MAASLEHYHGCALSAPPEYDPPFVILGFRGALGQFPLPLSAGSELLRRIGQVEPDPPAALSGRIRDAAKGELKRYLLEPDERNVVREALGLPPELLESVPKEAVLVRLRDALIRLRDAL